MKRVIFLSSVIVMSMCFQMQAQDTQKFEFNFLGDDFLLYKGTYLTLRSDAILGFDHTFYGDLKRCQSSYDNNVLYPTAKYNFNTEKDSLINRIFKVENIVEKSGETWTENTKSGYFDNPIFILKDTVTNQLIYYKYDKQYDFNFPFLSTKITFTEEYICSKLEREIDDFTNEIKINTPLLGGSSLNPVILYKSIKKGQTVYYLSLRTYGSTVNVNKTGVIVLFTDGTKWSRQSKIDVDVDGSGYEYSAFITLTADDLVTFSNKKIQKFRLYIYDEDVTSVFADKFKLFTKCIKNAK